MTVIKDLVDLVTQLDESVTDRKIRDLVLPVKEKALDVQREHLAIETKLHASERNLFESQKRHAEEIDRLHEQYRATIANLEKEYADLKSRHRALQDKSLVLHHGLLWDSKLNPHCPVCKTPLSEMSDSRFAHCPKCKLAHKFRVPGREVELEEIKQIIQQSVT